MWKFYLALIILAELSGIWMVLERSRGKESLIRLIGRGLCVAPWIACSTTFWNMFWFIPFMFVFGQFLIVGGGVIVALLALAIGPRCNDIVRDFI